MESPERVPPSKYRNKLEMLRLFTIAFMWTHDLEIFLTGPPEPKAFKKLQDRITSLLTVIIGATPFDSRDWNLTPPTGISPKFCIMSKIFRLRFRRQICIHHPPSPNHPRNQLRRKVPAIPALSTSKVKHANSSIGRGRFPDRSLLDVDPI